MLSNIADILSIISFIISIVSLFMVNWIRLKINTLNIDNSKNSPKQDNKWNWNRNAWRDYKEWK